MLRGDAGFRHIEHLMRAHHNCLLKNDRIRFKRSQNRASLENYRRITPIEAVIVEARPIGILKQALLNGKTHKTSPSLSGNRAQIAESLRFEPIDVETINDSDRIEMIPNNEWIDELDSGTGDDVL